MNGQFISIFLQAGIEDPNLFADFLVLGYVLMWVASAVYIISLWMRQRNTQQDLALLRRLLEEDEVDKVA